MIASSVSISNNLWYPRPSPQANGRHMRIGQNPAKIKGSPAYTSTRIGLATLTYVPALQGYFREALEVIQVHLASLRASLSEDCDLCVFDNGSCPQVLDFLRDQWQAGWIDWLFLSHHNMGKNGALNWIFAAMPNEYIAYSDSDVFFRKGWLEASLQIFDSFERAGMVSAQPVFFDFLRGKGQTVAQISQAGPDLQVLSVQPRPEVLEEYCDGINASEEIRQQFRSQQLQVAINQRSGVRAVTSATDMQFILRKKVAVGMTPMPIAGALTGRDAIEIPLGVEKLDHWILSTEEPLVWHMGNSLSRDTHAEIEPLRRGLQTEIAPSTGESRILRQGMAYPVRSGVKARLKPALQRWTRRSPLLKRWVGRLYDGLFSLLYEETMNSVRPEE